MFSIFIVRICAHGTLLRITTISVHRHRQCLLPTWLLLQTNYLNFTDTPTLLPMIHLSSEIIQMASTTPVTGRNVCNLDGKRTTHTSVVFYLVSCVVVEIPLRPIQVPFEESVADGKKFTPTSRSISVLAFE